ncbi:MAG: LptF/LptG family permease [Hydrococcus sp. Prado102]|jgi:lipopolysaccharide export system permease protein|nr:LptF/LptG family permease [Hydrococcus sp. Prado102]
MKIGQSKFFKGGIPGASIMDRYLLGELFLPFLFGMGLFTSLGISIGTLFDLVRRVTESGLPMDIAIQILFLKTPAFIVLAFPMAMLLATLMAYSRLSSDSELIALRSLGISVYRLVIPAIILSLLVSGLTFFISDVVTPAANYQATVTLKEALDQKQPAFRDRNIVYPEYTTVEMPDGSEQTILTRLFYAEEFDGEQMMGLTILDRTQEEMNQIINAKSATWNFKENTWDFFNGTIYLIAPDGSYRNIVRFKHQKLALPRAPLDLTQRRNHEEMSLAQSQEYLEIVKLSGNEEKVRKLQIRIQEKIAIPFACVAFGLVGSALGLRPQNSSRATSFGVCVGLIFAYYMLLVFTRSMGAEGILSPFMAAWLPNFLGIGAGGYLLYQSAK